MFRGRNTHSVKKNHTVETVVGTGSRGTRNSPVDLARPLEEVTPEREQVPVPVEAPSTKQTRSLVLGPPPRQQAFAILVRHFHVTSPGPGVWSLRVQSAGTPSG